MKRRTIIKVNVMQVMFVLQTIPPNRFDALGRLHELLGERAHDGPNFLGWHRLYIIL